MAVDESHNDRTQSFVALTKGTEVSHYRIVEKIGAGGMGEVYPTDEFSLHFHRLEKDAREYRKGIWRRL
ncbi:MAG: hypothetical protein KOO62_09820 [candidate division Zixibacteria bacterium]|nr:hypothetical protein [candidate division Zixibacteria bacterium]